ncbi:MAG: hypothetical protein ACRENO_10220 [Thermodesulfobacteriota bacterium]
MNLITINIIAIILLITASCSKKEVIPEFNIPGIKTSISRIQISPLAHDGARVVVLGFIKNIKSQININEPSTLTLSDIKDNSIEVEFNSDFKGEIDEQVIVGGLYRKDINRIVDGEVYKFIIEDDIIKPLNN